MTTIACDRVTMAGDTQLTDEGGPLSHGRKVYKHKGVVIGVAGTYTQCQAFIKWYKSGMTSAAPKMKDVHALLLTKDGIWFFDGTCNAYKITDPFMAIGSGALAAMAAMHLGTTPKEAVEIAGKVDPYTGGKINTRSIKQGT